MNETKTGIIAGTLSGQSMRRRLLSSSAAAVMAASAAIAATSNTGSDAWLSLLEPVTFLAVVGAFLAGMLSEKT